MDDGGAVCVHVAVLRFEDIALLQPFPIKHIRVDLWKGKLVHFSPLFCKEKFLRKRKKDAWGSLSFFFLWDWPPLDNLELARFLLPSTQEAREIVQ